MEIVQAQAPAWLTAAHNIYKLAKNARKINDYAYKGIDWVKENWKQNWFHRHPDYKSITKKYKTRKMSDDQSYSSTYSGGSASSTNRTGRIGHASRRVQKRGLGLRLGGGGRLKRKAAAARAAFGKKGLRMLKTFAGRKRRMRKGRFKRKLEATLFRTVRYRSENAHYINGVKDRALWYFNDYFSLGDYTQLRPLLALLARNVSTLVTFKGAAAVGWTASEASNFSQVMSDLSMRTMKHYLRVWMKNRSGFPVNVTVYWMKAVQDIQNTTDQLHPTNTTCNMVHTFMKNNQCFSVPVDMFDENKSGGVDMEYQNLQARGKNPYDEEKSAGMRQDNVASSISGVTLADMATDYRVKTADATDALQYGTFHTSQLYKLRDAVGLKRYARCYAKQKYHIESGDSVTFSMHLKGWKFSALDDYIIQKQTGTTQNTDQWGMFQYAKVSSANPTLYARGRGKFFIIKVETGATFAGDGVAAPTSVGHPAASVEWYARKEILCVPTLKEARVNHLYVDPPTYSATMNTYDIAGANFRAYQEGETTGIPQQPREYGA